MSDFLENSAGEKIKKVKEYVRKNKKLIESEQEEAINNPEDEPSGKMSWPQDDLNKRRELDD